MAPLRTCRAWPAALLILAACGSPPSENTESVSEALQQCPSQTVEGIDVFGGTGSINWTQVKGAGIDFAMIKATQGTYNTQSTFAYNWSNSKSAGIVRSAYHFFDPTEDGIAQAQHYLSVVGTLAPDDLPPMLDIECPDGSATCLGTGASGQTPAATIHQRMWDWIHTVEQATGKKPLIYSYGSYFSSNGIDTTGLDAYPLFIAYVTTSTCFNVPSPWMSAAFWQYSWTGTVSGISGQVDRDRFIGSLAALQSFAMLTSGASDGGGAALLQGDGAAPGSGADAGMDGGTSGASADASGAPGGGFTDGGPPSGGTQDGAGGQSSTGLGLGGGGGPEAGLGASGGSSPANSSGCGCRTAGSSHEPAGSGASVALLASVLAYVVRKTRRSCRVRPS